MGDLLGEDDALEANNILSYIVVRTYSWTVKLSFSTISKAGGRIFRQQVVMSEGHEENEGSVNETDAHSSKTKAE